MKHKFYPLDPRQQEAKILESVLSALRRLSAEGSSVYHSSQNISAETYHQCNGQGYVQVPDIGRVLKPFVNDGSVLKTLVIVADLVIEGYRMEQP